MGKGFLPKGPFMRFVGDVQMSLYKMVKLNKSAHSSMDRIAASEAVGAGSIPAGRTSFIR